MPSRGDFLADMATVLLGPQHEFERPIKQLNLMQSTDTPRQSYLAEATLVDVESLVKNNERLAVAIQAQQQIHFYHWELAFAELFHQKGGFDLIIGNPPWVKLSWNESGVLSDFEPLLAVRSMSASNIAKNREDYLQDVSCTFVYLKEYVEANGSQAYLNAMQNYALLKGVQTNLYKCFIVQSWELGSPDGIVGLLHPEGIYDDSRGGIFREQTYRRLKRHFMFENEIKLFVDVHNTVRYGVNIYTAKPKLTVSFHHISNVFHPNTVDECYFHDGQGEVPGIKNKQNTWELKGHRQRIVTIGEPQLAMLGQVFEEGSAPPLHTRLPLIHSQQLLSVLEKFATQPRRLGDLDGEYYTSDMWNETNAQKDGTIQRTCSIPEDASQWILSGPHIHIATPFYQTPNEGCRSHRAYSKIDLTTMPDDYLPRTVYTPACPPAEYAKRTPTWQHGKVTDSYRTSTAKCSAKQVNEL